MTITPITKNQFKKIVKAVAYSFLSGLIVALQTNNTFTKQVIYSAAVSAINGCLVAIRQLFVEE